MRKMITLVTLIAIVSLTGCQTDHMGQPNVQSRNQYYNQQTDANYNAMNTPGDTTNYGTYGYTRYQRQQVHHQDGQEEVVAIFDRDRLADGITRLVLTNPAIEEAAALVTDEHILVAYTTNDENREYVADQVKRTALSMAPRYYHVYITDDHNQFKDIERFQGIQSTSESVENTLEQTIENMKETSPQGAYNEQQDENMQQMKAKRQRLLQGE